MVTEQQLMIASNSLGRGIEIELVKVVNRQLDIVPMSHQPLVVQLLLDFQPVVQPDQHHLIVILMW